jgi:hypothetical protein
LTTTTTTTATTTTKQIYRNLYVTSDTNEMDNEMTYGYDGMPAELEYASRHDARMLHIDGGRGGYAVMIDILDLLSQPLRLRLYCREAWLAWW